MLFQTADNCFWMQFDGPGLPNILCKYAKWWIVGVEKHERMFGERESRKRPNQVCSHPNPWNYQPSNPAMFRHTLLASKTVGRRKQTVRTGMWSVCAWCGVPMYWDCLERQCRSSMQLIKEKSTMFVECKEALSQANTISLSKVYRSFLSLNEEL